MLARRAERNAGQPAGDRKDELVDVRIVEQAEDDIECVALVLWTVSIRTDRESDAAGFGFADEPRISFEVFFLAVLRMIAVEESRVDLDGDTLLMADVQ
jgi:hypothetical protein